MMHLSFSSRALLSVLFAAGAVAYGCGGNETSTSTSSSSSSSSGQGGELFPSVATSNGAGGHPSTSSSGQGGAMNCDGNPTTGTHVLSEVFGDASEQNGLAVAVDAQGNIAIAGAYAGTMKLGAITLTSAGGNDIFVAKLQPNGTPVWARSFGDAQNQSARGVAFDVGGNVVMTGDFKGTVNFGGGAFTSVGPNFDDVYLVKLNGVQGNHVWSEKFGDISSQTPHGIAIDGAGNIVIVGDFQNTLDFGGGVVISHAGDADVFVALFDSAGTAKWAKQLGDAMGQQANAVAFDKSGNVVVAGDATGTIDFGQGAQAVKGTKNAFAMKLSPQGMITWGKLYGTQSSVATGIAADASGNILITGDHQGDIDFGGGVRSNANGDNVFVARLDGNGGHLWSKSYGDDNPQHAKGIAVDAAGRAVVTGNFNGSIDFGGGKMASAGSVDMYLAKLDTHGCVVWQKSFGDPGFQNAAEVAVDGTGRAVLTGSVSGTLVFGGGQVVASGIDPFVAVFQP